MSCLLATVSSTGGYIMLDVQEHAYMRTRVEVEHAFFFAGREGFSGWSFGGPLVL